MYLYHSFLMSRTHVIRIEDGKTKEFYAEINRKDEDIFLQLFDSENSRFSKFEYDLKRSLPSFGSTATSIFLQTPETNLTFVFDQQNEKMNFLKVMNSASLVKKDNDYCSSLLSQMENNYVFPKNGLYKPF